MTKVIANGQTFIFGGPGTEVLMILYGLQEPGSQIAAADTRAVGNKPVSRGG